VPITKPAQKENNTKIKPNSQEGKTKQTTQYKPNSSRKIIIKIKNWEKSTLIISSLERATE
jgi:hypothetical protein